ncbi:MAG: cell division protein ZapE [Sphingomonadaceae bacterium]|nr:cell division protein ZapE [Sphingomonadaceae bacterium]
MAIADADAGTGPVSRAYAALLARGELRADADQAHAVEQLDALATALGRPRRGGLFARLIGREEPAPGGAYLWGGVGRGKTMLMDLFYAAAPAPKRRQHHHPFMLDIHARLHGLRHQQKPDPLITIAGQIADELRLLCLDEFYVTEPADALIMGRLFTALLGAGVAVVATSNRPPRDLYRNGLNRELFLPFIDLIEARLCVIGLNGPRDYRLDRLGGFPTYYVPNGPEATKALSAAFFRLTDYPVEDRANVPVAELDVGGGRTLLVPKSLKGVAVFSFRRLCGEARGAPDYIAVARAYHTVILVGVPVMGLENRNEAARFVTLIDTLYEACVKLLVAADAPPDQLYPKGDGSFEFERTASRLIEMQSADYLARGHCG